MKNKWIKNGTASIAVAALMFGAVPAWTQNAVADAAAAVKTLSSQSVKLSTNASLSISSAQFLMQDKGKVLAFTVNYANKESKSIDLGDYTLRLKTKDGKSFKVNVVSSNKDTTSITAKTNQYITYYATVDNGTQLSDLQFEIVKWDFDAPNFERKLGTIKASSNESNQVAPFTGKTMNVNNANLRSAIKGAFITKDQTSAYLTINFLFENKGLQTIDLSKYSFYIQTPSYSVYKVSASELSQLTLQPNERKISTMTVKLPLAVAGKKLSLVVATTDDVNKVALPAGEFLLPTLAAAPVTALGQSRSVYLSGQAVKTTLGKASLDDTGSTEKGVSVDYKLLNQGTDSIKLPDIEVYLKTKQNVNYPLTFTKDDSKLLPGIEKTLTLTGSIPSTVKVEDAEIVVRTVGTDKDLGYVIGSYKTTSTIQQGSLGSTFTMGDYRVSLNSIQRSPLEDSDMLVADISITNTTSVSKKIPSLNGYFLVNGVKVENASTVVGLDDSITIAPDQSYNMIVYTKIPYTSVVSNIGFVATEPVTDKTSKVLYQFSSQSLSTIPVISKDKTYEINSVGKKASIQLTRNAIFKGTTNNQFYAEFVIQNKESRVAAVSNLGGYLLDQNGQVVPITFATMKNKVLPNGKVLLSAYATLPNAFDEEHYDLYLGQAISKGPETGETAAQNAIAKIVSYRLNGEKPAAVKTDFQHIKIAGFDISLNNIRAGLRSSGGYNVDGMNLNMDYTLARETEYDYTAGDHKLVIEFVNNDNQKLTFKKSYSFTATEGSQNEILKEGKDLALLTSFDENSIQAKITDYNNFTINVYDEFQGNQLLIASKQFAWFPSQS